MMKSILPQFSNEHDWEMGAFELALALDRIWPHKNELNITDYLSTTYTHHDRDMKKRADSLIYFALTLSAKKDSYAKLQIMAACHPEAVPCVLRNEGKKLRESRSGSRAQVAAMLPVCTMYDHLDRYKA